MSVQLRDSALFADSCHTGMTVQVIYVMLEKFQTFTGDKFDMGGDVEQTYFAKLGNTAEEVSLSFGQQIQSDRAE